MDLVELSGIQVEAIIKSAVPILPLTWWMVFLISGLGGRKAPSLEALDPKTC